MPIDPFFHMQVQDVFSIRNRSTVLTGKIDTGTLRTGDEVVIRSRNGDKRAVVAGIEAFKKTLDQANAGHTVGILLAEISKADVQPGDELLSPDSGS
jgi:elongation factor Tu